LKFRMNIHITLFVILLRAIPCLVFAQTGEQAPKQVTSIIHQVKEEFCPDSRLSLFDVLSELRDSTIILTGETTTRVARDSCVQRIKRVTDFQVIDEIVILPRQELGRQTFGIIKLSTANLRRLPSVTAELVNQALLGSIIRLLKQDDGWYFCQLEDGYLGWMNKWSFQKTDSIGVATWEQRPKVAVTSIFSQVFSEKSDKSDPVSDLVCGNVLGRIKKTRKWIEVELPDGRCGFVRSSIVTDYAKMDENTITNVEKITKTAKRFLGCPYLWGGISPKGFDCSGFTKTVFGLNGYNLPRDANMQVHIGKVVEIDSNYSKLKAGDLLFFGKSPDRITHVGIYLGDKTFIHSDGMVRVGSFDPQAEHYDSYRVRSLQHVRRILGQ